MDAAVHVLNAELEVVARSEEVVGEVRDLDAGRALIRLVVVPVVDAPRDLPCRGRRSEAGPEPRPRRWGRHGRCPRTRRTRASSTVLAERTPVYIRLGVGLSPS